MSEAATALPALSAGGVAVVTGAASGIGLAAAVRFARLGLKVVLADLPGEKLEAATAAVSQVARAPQDVLALPTDVASFEAVQALAERAVETFGAPTMLMNNAGIEPRVGGVAENLEGWRHLVDVNFWGVVNGVQAFLPAMTDGAPRMIINTGSKQGITTPPGNAAYNVSKAALKAYTEAMAHELRNTAGANVSAHLLIPGFTYTGLTGRPEKPAGAWTSEQVVDFMLESLARGDFYILCPDNDVTRETDEKRMAWAIGDVIENRPALSRWHPDYEAAFKDFMAQPRQP